MAYNFAIGQFIPLKVYLHGTFCLHICFKFERGTRFKHKFELKHLSWTSSYIWHTHQTCLMTTCFEGQNCVWNGCTGKVWRRFEGQFFFIWPCN